MSRTYRTVHPKHFLRNPKTHNQRKWLIAAEEEIRDELGVNYLRGNFAKISKIPHSWDDIPIAALGEIKAKDEIIEGKISNSYELSELHRVNFNFNQNRNVIEILRTWGYWIREPKAYYFPFMYKTKIGTYPVRIDIVRWDWV